MFKIGFSPAVVELFKWWAAEGCGEEIFHRITLSKVYKEHHEQFVKLYKAIAVASNLAKNFDDEDIRIKGKTFRARS